MFVNQLRQIAQRIGVPEATKALLWDMDGTLLDTLALDYEICDVLLKGHFLVQPVLPPKVIQQHFSLDPTSFWIKLLEYVAGRYGVSWGEEELQSLVAQYEQARKTAVFEVCIGVEQVLRAARSVGLALAVVSNNPQHDVEEVLVNAGVRDYFSIVVGNDHGNLLRKPAPDTYVLAADRVGVEPGRCVVLEDSVLGAEAGKRAGCYTLGVATGGTPFHVLSQSRWVDRTYNALRVSSISLAPDAGSEVIVQLPDSQSGEDLEVLLHSAGMRGQVVWHSDDWVGLGRQLALALQDRAPARQKYEVAEEWGEISVSPGKHKIDLPITQSEPLYGVLSGLMAELGRCLYARWKPSHRREALKQVGKALVVS